MPVGAITIEERVEDVAVESLLIVVSSAVEEAVDEVGLAVVVSVVSVETKDDGEETTEDVPLVVSESVASSDESKFDNEGDPWEVEPWSWEDKTPLFVRL